MNLLKNRRNIIKTFGCLILVIFSTFFLKISATEEIYNIFIPSNFKYGAIRAAEQKTMFDEIIKFAQKELNMKISVILKGNSDETMYKENVEEIFNEFKNGKEGITILTSALSYIEAEEKKIPIKPYLTVGVKGKKEANYCIYVNSEDGIKNISQLKGKKINALNNMYGSLLVLKKILVDNNINTEIDKFFSQQVYYKTEGDALTSLLSGKLGCFYSDDVSTQFAMRTIYDAESIVPLACSKGYTRSGVFGTETKDPQLTNKILEIVQGAHKNPNLKKFSSIFETFGATFVNVTSKDYDAWRELHKEGKKKGWYKEIENWEKRFLEAKKEFEKTKKGKVK